MADPERPYVYKIEKGIPLPNPDRGAKYPGLSKHLGEMEVGASVFVPGGIHRYIGGLIAGKVGKKFAQRSMKENGVSGIRVFRIW